VAEQTGPFVGRAEPQAAFESALAGAARGQGRVVLVSGEAGIGKTRLCDQVGGAHRDGGGQLVVGRAVLDEAAIAFSAVADALRGARRSAPRLWEAAAARGDVLDGVVPELAASRAGPRPAPPDRPVVFEALLDAVDESTPADRATLWVLDDVHWADDATWQFVRYAARRVGDMSLVLAVTYRDEEIGPASSRWTDLVQLRRDRRVVPLALDRLGAGDAHRVVAALAPGLAAEQAAWVVERSAGTPLLIEELARLAGRPGDLPAIPDVVRATVLERTARLSPAGRELLELAAVAGLAVDGRLLEALRPGAPVGELFEVGLLRRDGSGYRFSHPLLWEAAQAEVAPARHRPLHEELATALSADGDGAVEQVAGHLRRAGRPEAALDVLAGSAAAARRGGDLGRSGSLSLAAFHLAEGCPDLGDRREALRRDAIQDLYVTRRWTELDPLLADAWSGRDRLAADDRARLAKPLAWQLFAQGRIAESWRLIEQELAREAGAGAHADPPTLHSQASYIAWIRGDTEAAKRHLDAEEDRARRAADGHALWWAEHFRAHLDYRLGGDRAAAVAAFRANAATARELGILDGEALARWDLACHSGDRHDLDEGLAAAERAGARATGQDLQVLAGLLELMEGHADAAESLLVRYGSRARAAEPLAAPWIDVNRALVALHRGQGDPARALLHGLASATEAAATEYHRADRAVALGWLAWEEGRHSDAAGQLGTSVQLWRTGCWHTLAGGPALLPLGVDALLRTGRDEEAGDLLARAPSPTGGRFYAAAHAAARFRRSPGPELAAEAESASRAARWPWLAAVVGTWRGELLGEPEAAAAALTLSEDIGADAQAARAAAVLRRLGAPPPRPRRHPGPLSERELEVAELVAEGLSNPAIAARLYLSRATVASHVAHILTKLGFSARTQIASWVAGQRG
jgi:DNA-binding CsgD family transcriptional regulator